MKAMTMGIWFFCPKKHNVFWWPDTSWTSARANWGVCPYYTIITIITIIIIIDAIIIMITIIIILLCHY